MEITFRKITDADILKAQKRLQYNIEERAIRKVYQKLKESNKSINKFGEIYNEHDATFLAVESMCEEFAGVPMPPPVPAEMAGLSSVLKKLRQHSNKVTSGVLRGVHKIVKKIGPAILGAVVSMIAGPAGQLVATALSKTASSYHTKRIQKAEYAKLLEGAKLKATALPSEMFKRLPISVTNEQAADIVDGKIPVDMTGEQVWHAVQQALLISKEKISPVDAYVLHYHTYGKNAPPIYYKVDPDKKLMEKLGKLQAEIKRVSLGTGHGILVSSDSDSGFPAMERKKKELEREEERLQKYIEQTQMKFFPGAPYTGAGPAPIPSEEKEEAVTATLSPETTNIAVEEVKKQLNAQGIDVKSPDAINLLNLQIKQLQQDLATSVAKGSTVSTPPTIVGNQAMPVQLPVVDTGIKISSTPKGDTKIETEKPKSNIGALLLPAAGILLALKGGG